MNKEKQRELEDVKKVKEADISAQHERMEELYSQVIKGIRFMDVKDKEGNTVVLFIHLPDMSKKLEADRLGTQLVFKYVKEGYLPERKIKKELSDAEIWTESDDKDIEKLQEDVGGLYIDIERLRKECEIKDIDSFIKNYEDEIIKFKKGSAKRSNRENLKEIILELNVKINKLSELQKLKDLYFAGSAEGRAKIEKDLFLMSHTILDENKEPFYNVESFAEMKAEELMSMRQMWTSYVRGIRKR